MTRAEQKDVTVGEVTLRTYDYGNAQAPDLVLVHGMQDFALSFDSLAEALSKTHHVVSYDLRGHGDSDKPGSYTMPHFVADLVGLIHHLGLEKPGLVGHSLGGHIVSQLAGIFPDVPSLLINVEGLGAPMRESDLPKDDRQWRFARGIQGLLQPAVHGRPMFDLDDAAGRFCRFHPGLDFELSKELCALGTEAHPDGGLQWKWDPRVQFLGLSRDTAGTEERWGWVECPTLLVTGGQAADFFVRVRGLDPDLANSAPEEIERRAALFRGAQHVVIEEAGHMVHFDAPKRLLDVIQQFL